MTIKDLLLLITFSCALTMARGEVSLPPLISDNMLLQRGKAAVWGNAAPGENITIRLGAIQAKTTANGEGKWRVKLPDLSPGIIGDMTVSGSNTLTVRNVAVGDVWLCSGQSNMEMHVGNNPSGVLNAAQEAVAADFPNIRMFTAPKKTSQSPVEDVVGKWEVCAPQNMTHWSATAYFFGRQLHKDLGIPIGLIHASKGGSLAQSWTPAEALQGDPDLKKTYYDKWQAELAIFPAYKANYYKTKLPAWELAARQAKADGKPIPPKPREPIEPDDRPSPSAYYNGMIFGAAKYPITGALWYQGEANVADSDRYHRLLPVLIVSWRKAWGQGDFPFYIVQLANFKAPKPDPADSNWANLRESQRRVSLEVPSSGLAVAIDLGEAGNIHPKNKQEVGRRLALLAEAKTYGKKITCSGPSMENVTFDGATAKVTFRTGTADGLTTKEPGAVKGFAIAGE